MLINQYELFKMFGEFITKMFSKMTILTNSFISLDVFNNAEIIEN